MVDCQGRVDIAVEGHRKDEIRRPGVTLGEAHIVDDQGRGIVVLDRAETGIVGEGHRSATGLYVRQQYAELLVEFDDGVAIDRHGDGLDFTRGAGEIERTVGGQVIAIGGSGAAVEAGMVDCQGRVDVVVESNGEDEIRRPGITLGEAHIVDDQGRGIVIENRPDSCPRCNNRADGTG